MDQVYRAKNRKSVALLVIFIEIRYVQVKLTYWQSRLKPILLILTKNLVADGCNNDGIYDNRNTHKENDCFFEKVKSTYLYFSLN